MDLKKRGLFNISIAFSNDKSDMLACVHDKFDPRPNTVHNLVR